MDQLSDFASRAETKTPRSPLHILVAEDNAADVFLIREALECAAVTAEIHVVSDGMAALRFLEAADGSDIAPCPCLLILDINLPKKSGDEVLLFIRQGSTYRHMLVLIVSTSGSIDDRKKMKELGCNGYFTKPSKYVDFMKLGFVVKEMLASH
jgi:CheY-like chemotaxis protein